MVEQVCLSRHQVQLRLESRLYIAIESKFSFSHEELLSEEPDYISSAHAFALLVESHINDARVVNDRTVKLVFSNGSSLSIFDSNDRYESFQIQLPGQLIVV